jgi:hypothetical protein
MPEVAEGFLVWFQYAMLHENSKERVNAMREISETVTHRKHLDSSVDFTGKLLFGFENGPSVLEAVRPSGKQIVPSSRLFILCWTKHLVLLCFWRNWENLFVECHSVLCLRQKENCSEYCIFGYGLPFIAWW